MRVFAGLVATLAAATIATAASALDREVRMQTVVGLVDRSDPAVKRAVREAFDTSLRGAVAMGFSRIRVAGIQVLQDSVVLATVATDRDNDDDEAPDTERDQ